MSFSGRAITRMLDGLVAAPRRVLLAALVLGAMSVSGLLTWPGPQYSLTVDSSLRALLPRDGHETAIFDKTAERYTSDDLLFVAWVDDELFTPERLAALKQFTRDVETIPGVEDVEGLATALRSTTYDDYTDVHAYLAVPPDTLAGALDIRDAAISNPLYAGYLVSRDGRGTLLAVRFATDLSAAVQLEIVEKIATASRAAAGDIEQFLSGPLYVRLAMSRLLLSDLLHVMPLAIAATLFVAALGFRHSHGVLVPLAANGLALGTMLAVFVRNGHALSYVTVILPPTVYVIGFAYAIHLVSDFDRQRAKGHNASIAARNSLRKMAAPVSFAALTTIIGFASLTSSDIDSIRLFGAYAAFGTALAWLATLGFVPAALALWPVKYRERVSHHGESRIATVLTGFAVKRNHWVLAAGFLLALWSVAGMFRIEVGTDYLANFSPKSVERQHFEQLNTLFAGAVPLQVVLSAEPVDTFKSRDALQAVADLQTWLLAQPEVGGVYSLIDYIAEIEQTLMPEDVDDDPVPATTALASHMILLGSGEDIRRFADSSFRSTLLQVRARSIASPDLNALSDRIVARLEKLPSGLEGHVTGSSYLIARTLDDVTRGQVLSMAASILPIFLILSWMLRSLRLGALALIPNVLPILAFFGILGWSGITLNLTTSLIAALVFGVAVDDTIHLLMRLRANADEIANRSSALRSTLEEIIRPVSLTTAGVALGFLALIDGELSSQSDFGTLAAITVGVAWLLDIGFTPALGLQMLKIDPRNRRDNIN
ncbi:MAG: putative RND superfamily exporter protein [Gammaproteobacteria bacterium]|jgi:predicted RND superfamily exporter protein